MKELSRRQAQLLDLIKELSKDTGCTMLTNAELGRFLGISALNTARLLSLLRGRGLISCEYGAMSRKIRMA